MILSKNVPDFGVIGAATDGAAVVAATVDCGIAIDGATEVVVVEGPGLAAGSG